MITCTTKQDRSGKAWRHGELLKGDKSKDHNRWSIIEEIEYDRLLYLLDRPTTWPYIIFKTAVLGTLPFASPPTDH